MNRIDGLERDLATWFDETAMPLTPEYLDDILLATASARQRPRWSFPGRWLPAGVVALGGRVARPVPWRTAGILAILALLLAVAVTLVVGSQHRRLPPPFGPAANGLVAYGQGGDIFLVDPDTGTRRAIVTGDGFDRHPRFSLDGARLAFLRQDVYGELLVIADADGSDEVVAQTGRLVEADTDSIAWSHDGRSIAITAVTDAGRQIVLIDATDGSARPIDADYVSMETYWRPPDGRQFMFAGGVWWKLELVLYSVDSGYVETMPLAAGDRESLRLIGWTPDGRRFAYQLWGRSDAATYVLDLATGRAEVFPVAYARLSNDGTRLVGFMPDAPRDQLCVVRLDGGPCRPIGDSSHVPDPENAAGLQWSPDDEWILSRLTPDGPVVVLDPDGGTTGQPTWIEQGAESWQRVAAG